MLNETFRIENDHIVRTVKAGKNSGETRIGKTPDTVDDTELPKAWWSAFLRGDRIVSDGSKKLTVVDLFSGSGGLTLGVTEAARAVGFSPEIAVCADMDIDALRVYEKNFGPRNVLHSNIGALVDYHVYGRGEECESAYPPEILDPILAKNIGSVDLLVAGPPCQGHSNLNNHTRRNDPRNQLYLASVAIGIALKAKNMIIENVPGVVKDMKDIVASAKKVLIDAGYHISEDTLNAAELGAGQSRKRHFLIATSREHLPLNEAALLLKKSPMDLMATIGDLELEENGEGMFRLPSLSEENQERIDYLFDNDLHDLPNHVRPLCHRNGHTYNSVYGRLHWDKPSPTITTGFSTPGRGRYIHPSRRRLITPREAARIQGFPDWFDFLVDGIMESNKQRLYKWIGDAVPSPLGYSAALAAFTSL